MILAILASSVHQAVNLKKKRPSQEAKNQATRPIADRGKPNYPLKRHSVASQIGKGGLEGQGARSRPKATKWASLEAQRGQPPPQGQAQTIPQPRGPYKR